jgi:formate-dependent phosphoribosylglycinamide formyltransferase (GAR transformylase)
MDTLQESTKHFKYLTWFIVVLIISLGLSGLLFVRQIHKHPPFIVGKIVSVATEQLLISNARGQEVVVQFNAATTIKNRDALINGVFVRVYGTPIAQRTFSADRIQIIRIALEP